MNTTTTTTKLYRHPTLPIEAPADYWRALNFSAHPNQDTVNPPTTLDSKDINECLLIGLEQTQANDHRPIVWALQEIQRRRETKTQSTAVARLAEAVASLSNKMNLDVKPLETAVQTLTQALLDNRYGLRR